MAESVTVEHGGVSITTNTASEADLRQEMEAPAAPPAETEAQAAERARDERGRFARADQTTQVIVPDKNLPLEEPAPETPARRRDDTLPRHDPQARMRVAIAKAAEAERRANQAEAELARYRQPGVTSPVTPVAAPPATPSSPEPQFEQFSDQPDPYTAYVQAWARWDRAEGLRQAKQEWDQEQQAKVRGQTFAERITTGRAQYADFDQVLTDADTLGLQVSAVMQEAIADSPHAADLVYYLATHPEECTQLAEESRQTPVTAATVMRRLLEGHLAPPAAPRNGSGPAARATGVSTAKPPVQPVGSSPVVSDDPPGDTASAADHARYWNRRLKVPGTR